MRSVTHHLTVMIEEVLSYSSLEMGYEITRPSEFIVSDLVRAVIAVVEPLARQKRLALIQDVPAEPIRMVSDADKVRQILVNLAGNAIKFTDAGEVRLSATADNGDVTLAVSDTGLGLYPDEIDRLFRPFTQLDTSLTRRHGGTGLGLYISRRLADLLGGRIDVVSNPGKGSMFSLMLPREP